MKFNVAALLLPLIIEGVPLKAEEALSSKVQQTAQKESDDQVLKKIEGTWRIVDGKNQGKPLSAEELSGNRVIVGENMIAVVDAKEAELYKAELKISTVKEPYHIDMIASMPEGSEQKALGIFKLTEDGWLLCYGLKGSRPEAFVSDVEQPNMLFSMKKIEKREGK